MSARGRPRSRAAAWLVACACLSGTTHCKPDEPQDSSADAPPPAVERHVGDLGTIRERGELRILSLRRRPAYLPRSGAPDAREREIARQLADELGVRAVFVSVERFSDLIPALLEGRGDLIADNLTLTAERRERVRFSTPVAIVREQLITRSTDPAELGPATLAGRKLHVPRGTSFWQTAQELAERSPGLEIIEAPNDLEPLAMIDATAEGRFDLTLADSNVVEAALSFRDDVRVAFDASGDRLISFAMRPGSPELRKAADRFLARRGRTPASRSTDIHTDDLDGILARGALRVLTRNNATTYFIWRGEIVGFEYDLMRRFASDHGLRVELIVPPSRADLVPWLRQGRGDVVAAGLTASPERAATAGVAFSAPYHSAQPLLIGRPGATPQSPRELAGRTVSVRRSSSYWTWLERLRESEGVSFQIVPAPEVLETEEIIGRVAAGALDLTAADSHIAAVELAWRDDIELGLPLAPTLPHGWAVRPDNPKLLSALDAFIERIFRSAFYNITRRKYFENTAAIRSRAPERPTRAGAISPYDALVQTYADRYGFDWRMMVSQMYQESRFDPTARSFAGARGLMQVLPRTAREFGFRDLSDPETGIHAGARYMSWVRERFEPSLPAEERQLLALAAYNAGFGHVQDARRIAAQQGLDPDRWFGHVEKAILEKRRPNVYRHTRFGYCRCEEPVRYVRQIRDRYRAYLDVSRQRPDPLPAKSE